LDCRSRFERARRTALITQWWCITEVNQSSLIGLHVYPTARFHLLLRHRGFDTKPLRGGVVAVPGESKKPGGVFAALEQNLIQSKVAATRTIQGQYGIRRKEMLTGAAIEFLTVCTS